MAKITGKAGGSSRIRFVMVEADLHDGDIGQITQVISNALRGAGSTTTIKRITAPAQPLNAHSDREEAEIVEDEIDDLAETEAASQPMRPRAERKAPATPEVLPIDFNAFEPALGAFVSEHKVDSHRQRYLLAAAWFNEHGGVTKVTPAHIYTAYRWLKWPLTIEDFAQPLRDLKKEKLFGSTERGTYTINHIGLQRVADMKSSTNP